MICKLRERFLCLEVKSCDLSFYSAVLGVNAAEVFPGSESIRQSTNLLATRRSLVLSVLLLAGCSFEAVEVQQEQVSSLAGTAGRTLVFSIESPGSVPGNAITVYRVFKYG